MFTIKQRILQYLAPVTCVIAYYIWALVDYIDELFTRYQKAGSPDAHAGLWLGSIICMIIGFSALISGIAPFAGGILFLLSSACFLLETGSQL